MKTGGLMQNDLEQFASGELKAWSLQPDPAVWDAVAERIRKERRRRIIFWWTAAAMFLLVSTGAWMFIQQSEPTESAIARKELLHSNKQANHASIQSDKEVKVKSSVDSAQEINNVVNPKATKVKQVSKQLQTVSIRSKEVRMIQTKQSGKQQLVSTDDSHKLQQQVNADKITNTQNVNAVKTAISANVQEAHTDDQNGKADSLAGVERQSIMASITNNTDSINTGVTDTAQKKKADIRKLKWYFSVQTGFSDIRPNELLRLAAAQDMQFSGGASPVIGTGNISGVAVSPGNLQYQAGASFSLGIGVLIFQKKQWQISAGLQYRYASMRLVTGAKVDTVFQARDSRINSATTVAAFYRPGNGYTYQHQFHFVQTPIMLHLQPFGLANWRVDVGLLPGVLLGASALHYNEVNNIFYANNRQYQKFLLNGSLGVQYAIPLKKDKKLWIGPQFELGLRNMHQSTLSRKAFFQSANLSFTLQ